MLFFFKIQYNKTSKPICLISREIFEIELYWVDKIKDLAIYTISNKKTH